MKNYRVSIRKKLITIIAFFQISYNMAAQEVSTEWSGSASYSTRHQKHVIGDFVTIKNAIENKQFFEYHTEATIVNGVGVAKSRFKKSYWAKDPKIVALDQPPTSCFTTEEGSGESSAGATLLISMSDGYYSFSISTPEVNVVITGTQNCSSDKPTSSVSHHTEPGFYLTPEVDQQLKDPNVLEGEIVVRFGQPVFPDGPVISTDKFSWWEESANAGPISGEFFEKIIKWHFVRAVPEDVELIITPKKYDSWLPEPGKPEEKHGKPMEVDLKLITKGAGKKNQIKAESFEVTLVNTSAEPGRTINYPIEKVDEEPFDIQLRNVGAKTVQGTGQELTLPANNGQSASFLIVPYDGGGYTTLQAKATLSDGRVITGKLLSSSGPADVLIPKRREGRLIGDDWLRQNPSNSDEEDNEKSQGNQNNGDGFSAYEEYRGIFSHGAFKRLNHKKKNLLVQISKTDLNVMDSGLYLLAKAADIEISPLDEKELQTNRIVNANNKSVHNGDQLGIILINGPVTDRAGNKDPGTSGIHLMKPGTDKAIIRSIKAIVDVAGIKEAYLAKSQEVALKWQAFKNKPASEKKGKKPPIREMPYTENLSVFSTVAHELAHGLDVSHHGESGGDAPRYLNYTKGRKKVIAYDIHQQQINYKQDTLFKGIIGIPQGEASGDIECLMVYNDFYRWARNLDLSDTTRYFEVPVFAPGRKLCTNAAATGFNKTALYFGHAKWGNCLGKIMIKSY